MKTSVKLTGMLLAFIIVLSAVSVSVVPASAITPLPIVIQNDSKWTGSANTYGTGTLRATGCGIFSLVNAVGYLTGKSMDVNEVAAWAYSIGAYNAGGADGTYRFELYPYVEARYGAKYGFTLDCNGTQGWWQGSSSTILKNHLANGGVAIGHVPNHFIAIVGYDSSKSACYHIYDSYPTNSRDTYPGDTWVTQSHLATGSLKLDWFCLLSLDNSSIASAPTINVASTVAHNSPLSVSWGAVSNAVSYKYKVDRYDGEMSGTTPTTIVPETSTTGTSFTIPAQSTGKYYKVTVTAVGENDSKSATAIVMAGPWSAYPSGVQYIPINEINGTVTAANSCILTYDYTTAMAFTYWRGFLLAPNSDGSYTVSTVYEFGETKTLTSDSNKLVLMIHQSYTGYQYAEKIKVGDKITLHGVYVDKNTIRGNGYALVNGGIPLAPEDITSGDTKVEKIEGKNIFRGFATNTTVQNALASFEQEKEYLEIRSADGKTLAATDLLSTGCTVNVVVDSAVSVSYAIVVSGDVNGDGTVNSTDYVTQKKVIKGDLALDGAYALAVDYDCDNMDSTADYIALYGFLAG